MLRVFVFVFAAIAFARAAIPIPTDAESFTAKEIAQGYRDGVFLAKPRAAARASADTAESREGHSLRRKFTRLGDMRMLGVASGETTEEAIARLRATGRYELVEPDRILYARVTPNDPSFSSQWALLNSGQSNGTPGADVSAATAWDVTREAPNVIVAVIDSGMRLTHTDLIGNLWTNASPSSTGYTNDVHGINATVSKTHANSGNPADNNGHGTHVAGIIGAVGNNGVGIAGVAWKVQLMPLKFLTADGSGSTSDNIACIDYAIAHGVAIINASYGSGTYSAAEFAAIQSARDAGIIFVAAAGNDSANSDVVADYPAAYPLDNIVTVAATDRTDVLASFSNYGAGSVDLAAPGDDILSTYHRSDTSYQSFGGTSMAAPHVTGALALLKAAYPSDNYRQTINRLLRGSLPLAALRGKVQTGGRLNLTRALAATSSAPFNDDFSSRAVLAGENIRVRASNSGATRESGEPAHAGISDGATVWWTWTAPRGGTVSFDTNGSAYASAVAVYTGAALDSLQLVSAASGRADIQATASTTYQIAVVGANGSAGLTTLKIGTIPQNDAFASAELIEGRSIRVDASTVNASRETGEPTIAGVAGGHSLWYRWIAPTTGRYHLAAFSETLNTLAAVYTGSSLGNLTLVGANNNASSANSDALVGFNATAGTTYHLAIDHVESSGGTVTLTLTDSLWQYPTNAEVTSSPAVGSDGTVYVGSNDGYLYALTADGTFRWRSATGGALDVASPAVGSDGTVYVGSNDRWLYAFNGSTGARRWRFSATSSLYSAPAIGRDGTIYFRDDTSLQALTNGANSATRQWSVALSGATYSSPAIGPDGTIYVGATDGKFYAVNPDGTTKWTFTADGDIYTSPAIATDGTIYFATLAGNVYALNPSGTQKWTWHLTALNNSITSSLALAPDGTVHFATYDHTLHALRADGIEKWVFRAGDEIRASSPAVAADGTVYFGAYDGRVYAVKSDGTLQRHFATAARVRSSPLLANERLYFGSNDGKLHAFHVGQNAAPSAWPMYRQNGTRTGRAPTAVIAITTQPASQVAVLGGSFMLSVVASSDSPVTYQWYKDNVAIAGATASSYTVANVTAAAAGSYTVVLTNALGSATSTAAVVSVQAAQVGRLINLSVRAPAGSDAQTLIVGFVVTGSKPLVVRGIGPALAAYGVGDALPDPALTVYSENGAEIDTNDNWNGDATLAAAFTSVGAFALAPTSLDAALLHTFPAGTYTAHVTQRTAETGTVLAEIYDANTTGDGRLVNISARAQVRANADPLIAGFVISGNVPRQVLVRGSGPALITFGVAGTLPNPKLTLYRESTAIDSNDDWGSSANKTALAAAATKVGAFALDETAKDAALLVTLAPGNYTAQLASADNNSGVGLIEVYELP